MPTFKVCMMTHYYVEAKNAKEALNEEADMNQIWNNARYDIEKVRDHVVDHGGRKG